MATMYDSISAASIPADAEVVAGYVDGWWADFIAIQLRFPHLPQVSITTCGKDRNGNWVLAIVCDCENGDATPATATAWAQWMISIGHRPTIYCNTSTHGDVVAELAKLGLQFVRDVDWWEAHYDNDPSLSPGSVSKQYQSTDGWDISSTDGTWPAASPAPGPIPIPTQKDDDMYAFVVQPPVAGQPPTKDNEVVIPCPPFRKGLVVLACDFAPQQLRIMIGGPTKGWRHAPTSDPDGEVGIPVGRSSSVAIEFEADDEVVSIRHRGGNGNDNHPVTALVIPT